MASTGYATSPTTATEDTLTDELHRTRATIRTYTGLETARTAEQHDRETQARQTLVHLIAKTYGTGHGPATLPLSTVRLHGTAWREALQATDSATHTVPEYRAARREAVAARHRVIAALTVAYLETDVSVTDLAALAGTTVRQTLNLLDFH